ncbi:MAG: hypothetical protein ACK5LY_05915 [Lachnospirales bacterium]
MKKKEDGIETVDTELIFKKEQIIKSKMFEESKDILGVILNNNEKYSLEDVKKKIEIFKKGGCK